MTGLLQEPEVKENMTENEIMTLGWSLAYLFPSQTRHADVSTKSGYLHTGWVAPPGEKWGLMQVASETGLEV